METTKEDRIATVHPLTPRAEAPRRGSPRRIVRATRSEHTTGNVVELSRRRRPAPPEHFEPQGGDAA